jgi:hypothetical protein
VTNGLSIVNDNTVSSQGRLLKPSDKIYDLVDEAFASKSAGDSAKRKNVKQEIIYDLVDVIEKRPKMAVVDTGLHDEIMRRAVEIAEKIAREVIPDIAERVIREEIEKLKKGS